MVPVAALSHSVIVAACLAAGCGVQSGFQCVDDTQCGPTGGTCQADGWCSFPDDVCASGQRYGEHAGDGLGGACVTTPAGSSGPGTDGPTSGTSLDSQGGTTASLTSGGETTVGVDATDSTGAAAGSSGDETTGAPIGDPSLIAWYTFDDLRAPYVDVSGNGHDGWCGGDECPEAVVGVDGAGVSFDGLDDHLHVDHTDALALYDDFTIAIWFRVDAFGTGWAAMFAKPIGADTANSWEFGLDPGNLYGGGGDELQQSGVDVSFDDVGVWHHAAMTWGGSEIRVYLDGDLAGTAPAGDIAYDGHTILLGADVDARADDDFFAGALDDARIYARVLDESEIAALATAP
jgi:hypothetical protein